jgi:hypothetical protein
MKSTTTVVNILTIQSLKGEGEGREEEEKNRAWNNSNSQL